MLITKWVTITYVVHCITAGLCRLEAESGHGVIRTKQDEGFKGRYTTGGEGRTDAGMDNIRQIILKNLIYVDQF